MSRICYEATIKVEFEPSWEIEDDEMMWNAAGTMSMSIEQLAKTYDPTVKVIEIGDYSEVRMEQ